MITQAAQQFAEGVKQIDGLEVVGKPDMCLVAIKSTSKKLNIYKVNDLMSQRGWHLNALQFPSSVHMCFTAQHTEVVPELLKVASPNLPTTHGTFLRNPCLISIFCARPGVQYITAARMLCLPFPVTYSIAFPCYIQHCSSIVPLFRRSMPCPHELLLR